MQKIFSIEGLKANSSTAGDCLVIPNWIFDRLIELCYDHREYAGYLACFNLIVEYPYLSAIGDGGSVFPSRKLVVKGKGYTTIEFHTHPHTLGDYWEDKFSDGDLNTFRNRVSQEGKDYQHILFTPTKVLTWGHSNAPDVRIGFGQDALVKQIFSKWNQKHQCWD